MEHLVAVFVESVLERLEEEADETLEGVCETYKGLYGSQAREALHKTIDGLLPDPEPFVATNTSGNQYLHSDTEAARDQR